MSAQGFRRLLDGHVDVEGAREVLVWRWCYGEHSDVVLDRIRDWFRAHGVDPNLVPANDSAVYRHTLPNLPGITYEQYVFEDVAGVRILLRGPGGHPERETVWMPMEANPLPFPDLREPSPDPREDSCPEPST